MTTLPVQFIDLFVCWFAKRTRAYHRRRYVYKEATFILFVKCPLRSRLLRQDVRDFYFESDR